MKPQLLNIRNIFTPHLKTTTRHVTILLRSIRLIIVARMSEQNDLLVMAGVLEASVSRTCGADEMVSSALVPSLT